MGKSRGMGRGRGMEKGRDKGQEQERIEQDLPAASLPRPTESDRAIHILHAAVVLL